jgi:transcription elongation factor GreB
MRGKSREAGRSNEAQKPSYITLDGYRKLEQEADRLWNVERPHMAQKVQEAAAEGDLSENAEYQYSKKRLAEIDQRLSYLGERMKSLRVVQDKPKDDGRVYFGCWVTLADEEGEEKTYRIVGPDETDAENGWISVESPMARALLTKEEGDEVTVQRPKGDAEFEIVAVYTEKPS